MSARRAASPGLSDVEYFAQSMYEPDAFIVPGFNPGMPAINKPPIGLTDQEILCVIAYLQTLGGTPTVTLQTTHRYHGAAAPHRRGAGSRGCSGPRRRAGRGAAPAPPTKGAQLRPDAIPEPVVAHQSTARHDGAVTR